MKSDTLLTRKRARNGIKPHNGIIKNKNLNTEMLQFNGFNIIEFNHTDFIPNNIAPKIVQNQDKSIIEIKENESDLHEIIENNPEIKELKRSKAKNIEEYFTSKNGISTIKENCFKCLLTNFLSNELLYFNSRKDLFNYIKYCFLLKNKLIITDEDTFQENKEKFFNANASFINGWRFFIPKTICKGCFMEIINMKNLISNIKTIFCDIEKDSLCKTNYRNYALFSSRFRAEFNLKNRSRNPRRKNRSSTRNSRSKISRRNFRNKSMDNIKCIIDDEQKGKIYNDGVEYIMDKNIIIINKKNLENSVLDQLKNNSFYKNDNFRNNNLCKNINDNKLITYNKHNSNEKSIKKLSDKKNQNDLNTLNGHNKNALSLNTIHSQLRDLYNNINNIFQKLWESSCKMISFIYCMTKNLSNMNSPQFKNVIFEYDKEKVNFTDMIKRLNDFNDFNKITNEIKINMKMNEKEKMNLSQNLQGLKVIFDGYKRCIIQWDTLLNEFRKNYTQIMNWLLLPYYSFLQN